jgi:hypothetical protein
LLYFPSSVLLHSVRFSPFSPTLLHWQGLGRPGTCLRPRIPPATLRVSLSLSPIPSRCVGFIFSQCVYLFLVLIFIFFFYFIYLLYLYIFLPYSYFIPCLFFPSLLADCTLGTPNLLNFASILPSLTLVKPYLLSPCLLITTLRAPSHIESTLQVSCSLLFSDSWPLKMGRKRCPETSVNNYHTTPRNIPEERNSSQSYFPPTHAICSVVIITVDVLNVKFQLRDTNC